MRPPYPEGVEVKVKDVIVRAATYVGRRDVANLIESGTTPEGESAEAAETLLYCYNAVEDEIARCYIPLKTREKLSSSNGVYRFSAFTYVPIKISCVTDADGRDVKYTAGNSFIECGERIIYVEYEYSPQKKELDDDCAFTLEQTTVRMIAAGTAAEYCLINGEVRLAECYECVYRQEIDGVRRRAVSQLKFPPRRWV